MVNAISGTVDAVNIKDHPVTSKGKTNSNNPSETSSILESTTSIVIDLELFDDPKGTTSEEKETENPTVPVDRMVKANVLGMGNVTSDPNMF